MIYFLFQYTDKTSISTYSLNITVLWMQEEYDDVAIVGKEFHFYYEKLHTCTFCFQINFSKMKRTLGFTIPYDTLDVML